MEKQTYVKYENPPASPVCVVFDMDETLCTFDQVLRLGKCEKFEPKEEMVELARELATQGVDIVIATARPHFLYYKTRRWLREHGLNPKAIYMRDGRQPREYRTSQMKAQMLKDVRKTWNIEAFYDDSPYNVGAARELGVNALMVPGNEEFWLKNGEGTGAPTSKYGSPHLEGVV